MKDTTHMTEAELADYYDRTGDLSEFEDGEVVEIEPGPKSSIVSVRFALGELEAVEQQANKAGMKLTAFIRASALSGAHVVDLDRLRKVAAKLVADSEEMGKVVALPTRRSRPAPSSGGRSSAGRSGRTSTFQKSSRSAAAAASSWTASSKASRKAAASKSASGGAARKSTTQTAKKSPPKGKA